MKFLHRMKDKLLSYINNIKLLIIRLGQFKFNISNKCHLVTFIKKFISSTGLHTVFGLFALQLTAALPFSMRTSSCTFPSIIAASWELNQMVGIGYVGRGLWQTQDGFCSTMSRILQSEVMIFQAQRKYLSVPAASNFLSLTLIFLVMTRFWFL